MPSRKSSLENLALARLSNPNFKHFDKVGKRHGGGRKKGQLAQATLDKMKVKKNLDQRFLRATDKIANAQIALASGLSFLYRVHTDKKGVRSKPELITSQSDIESYLEGSFEHDESDYYYITTKEPSNQAIDSILNRVHGKPTESLDVQVEVFSLRGLAEKRKRLAFADDAKITDAEASEIPPASPSDSDDENAPDRLFDTPSDSDTR